MSGIAARTMTRAATLGLPFLSSRATPDELAPVARRFFDAGGEFLAHRTRLEYGAHDVTGDVVEWHATTGSVDEMVDTIGRYAELGVRDLSIIPGQDDTSSLRTTEVLASEVMPRL